MNQKAQTYLKQALKVLETTRYRIGVHAFCSAFIDQWAFLHSGLYRPPETAIPDDLIDVSKELSHHLSSAMRADPTGDVLGSFLSEVGFNQRGTSFYPTPSSVSQLMAELIGVPDLKENKYYEPCCGTAILTIAWLESRYKSQGAASFKDIEIRLEDIDPLMAKVAFLQLLFYFESRKAWPEKLSISAVDVISRKESGVRYYAKRKTVASKAHAADRVA